MATMNTAEATTHPTAAAVENLVNAVEYDRLKNRVAELEEERAEQDRKIVMYEKNLKALSKCMTLGVRAKNMKMIKSGTSAGVQGALSNLSAFFYTMLWPKLKMLPAGWERFSERKKSPCQILMAQIKDHIPSAWMPEVFFQVFVVDNVRRMYSTKRCNTVAALKAVFLDDMEKGELWDHQIDELIENQDNMRGVNVDAVRILCLNREFMKFAYKYCRLVSHTKKEIDDELKDGCTNLFSVLDPSDIAYGITTYINNDRYWPVALKKKKEKCDRLRVAEAEAAAALASEASAKGKRKSRRGSGGKQAKRGKSVRGGEVEKEVEEAAEEDGDENESTKPRWTTSRKAGFGTHGFSPLGKMFYDKIHDALKELGEAPFEKLWQDYWESEKAKLAGEKKRSEPAWKTEDDSGDGPEIDLFPDSDDDLEIAMMEPV